MGKTRTTSSAFSPGKAGIGHGVRKVKGKVVKMSVVRALGPKVVAEKGRMRVVTQGTLEEGDKVEVEESKQGTKELHQAKVVKVGDHSVLVHYVGWNPRYDEWLHYPGSARQVLAEKTNQQLVDVTPTLDIPESGRRRSRRSLVVQEAATSIRDIQGLVTLAGGKQEKEEEQEVKEEAMGDDGLCEYERIRANNIRQREALFASLDFSSAKDGLSPSARAVTSAGPSRRGLQSVKREVEVTPRRVSSRLLGGSVPEIERWTPSHGEVSKPKKLSRDMKAWARSHNLDIVRKPTKDISRRGLARFSAAPEPEAKREGVEQRSLSVEECRVGEGCPSLLASLAKPLEPPQPGYRADLSKVTIGPERVAKVVPDRIFSLTLHPGSDKIVAAAGDKWGKVGLWDCLDTESSTHGVQLFQYHSRPVNCLTWDTASSSRLVSTSYDGTTRCLDVDHGSSSLLYCDPDFLESGGWASYHCQPDGGSFLVTLGNQGTVVRVDTRAGALPVASYHLFHRMHAKTISCHPLQPHLLLTGHNKGGVFIFDLRGGAAKGGLLQPVTELLGATRSISSCSFSAVSGSQAITISADDKLRLYDTSSPGAELRPVCQVKHNNQTGRWLTPFRAAWHPTRENFLATGSMERPRQVELWSTSGGNLSTSRLLRGEELGSVASLVALHPARDVLVGGNSSGRLHLFM